MRLELSRRAQTDLDDLRDYSLTQFGIVPTIAYLDAIEAAFRRLIEYPEIGVRDPRWPPAIRSLSCGQHRILYAPAAARLLIVRILHQSMDVERHL